MTKFLIPALALTAGLAACSNNAQDQTAQAANAIAADASGTTANAVDDVSAASDRAVCSAWLSFPGVSGVCAVSVAMGCLGARRQRAMVWSRRGPTLIIRTGTPACFSMSST